MALTSVAAKDVMRSDSSTYHPWYNNIRDSVPANFWPYFDPENDKVYEEPIRPVRPVLELPPTHVVSGPSTRSARAQSSQTQDGETVEEQAAREDREQRAREARFDKKMDIYFKLDTIYREDKREWGRFCETESKIREKIKKTISKLKAAPLDPNKPIRQWLLDLKKSSTPTKSTTKQAIKVEYKNLMSFALTDWPTGGPSAWLAKWEDIIYRAEQYSKPFEDWLEDISLVWIQVPDLNHFFNTVEDNLRKEETNEYTYASVSADIQQCWERKKQRLSLRPTRPKATRSAFTTQDVTFNDEAVPEVDSAVVNPEASSKKSEVQKKKKLTGYRNRLNSRGDKSRTRSRSPDQSYPQKRARSPQRSRSYHRRSYSRPRSPRPTHSRARSHSPRRSRPEKKSRRNDDRDPCLACGGKSHSFERCFLVKGIDLAWIPEESKDKFKANMKKPDFKKRVEEFRAGFFKK